MTTDSEQVLTGEQYLLTHQDNENLKIFSTEIHPDSKMLSFKEKSFKNPDRGKLVTKVAHLVNRSKKNSRDFDQMKISEEQRMIINKYRQKSNQKHTNPQYHSHKRSYNPTNPVQPRMISHKSQRSFIISPHLNSIRQSSYKSKLGIAKFSGTPNLEEKFKSVSTFGAKKANKENYSTMRGIKRKLFQDSSENRKMNFSYGDSGNYEIMNSSKKIVSKFDSNSYITHEVRKNDNREPKTRPSMSSFHENDISESMERKVGKNKMNTSLRKKSPKQ